VVFSKESVEFALVEAEGKDDETVRRRFVSRGFSSVGAEALAGTTPCRCCCGAFRFAPIGIERSGLVVGAEKV